MLAKFTKGSQNSMCCSLSHRDPLQERRPEPALCAYCFFSVLLFKRFISPAGKFVQPSATAVASHRCLIWPAKQNSNRHPDFIWIACLAATPTNRSRLERGGEICVETRHSWTRKHLWLPCAGSTLGLQALPVIQRVFNYN